MPCEAHTGGGELVSAGGVASQDRMSEFGILVAHQFRLSIAGYADFHPLQFRPDHLAWTFADGQGRSEHDEVGVAPSEEPCAVVRGQMRNDDLWLAVTIEILEPNPQAALHAQSARGSVD